MKRINETKAWEDRAIEERWSSKDCHAMSIDMLMRDQEQALRLHIDNLVLTYGFEAVETSLERTSLNLIRKDVKAS